MIEPLVTSLLMRVKGGGPDNAPKWFRDLDGHTVAAVAFSGLCLLHFPWWQALGCGIAWYVGNKPSMGEEAGAIGGYKGHWFSDRDSWFASKWLGFIESNRAWGFVSGALRGLFLGVCLSLATLNPWFLITATSFSLCYWVGISIEQKRSGASMAAWNWAEWLYGAFVGLAFYAQ